MASTNTVSHIKITQAGLISLLVTVVGQVVAFVPSIASDQEILISAGSTVIAAVFMVVNSIHALAGSKVVAAQVAAPAVLASAAAPVPPVVP
jgi:hypothetical protein